MQYTAIFHGYKNDNFQMKKCATFLIFAQNIGCGYTSGAVLTITHDLCFRAKLRIIMYTQVLLYKSIVRVWFGLFDS